MCRSRTLVFKLARHVHPTPPVLVIPKKKNKEGKLTQLSQRQRQRQRQRRRRRRRQTPACLPASSSILPSHIEGLYKFVLNGNSVQSFLPLHLSWTYETRPWADGSHSFPPVTAISITTVILALNISLPNLSNPSTQSLSTYQTRLPTIQYRNPIPKFIYLSYLNPVNGLYFKGNDDIYFVAFWVLVWLTLRELSIKYFWTPIGLLLGLEHNSSKLIKFGQQGWNLAYYVVFWSIGIKILSGFPDSIWALNIRQYWAGYPQDSIPGLTKFYYLSQAAFWLHSMIVLNIEKHRKDHYQMLTHHVVTILLICGSYALNITGIGSAIHTTMDFCDILLCISKMLNYLEAGLACDVTFTLFMVSWVITRHIIFGKIIWSIYANARQDIPWVWNPSQGSFACTPLWIAFIVLLLFLQVILLVWLRLILRIIWGVIIGNGADDERSDTEFVSPFLRDNEIETRQIDEKDISESDVVEEEKEPLLINTPRLESLGTKSSKLHDKDLSKDN